MKDKKIKAKLDWRSWYLTYFHQKNPIFSNVLSSHKKDIIIDLNFWTEI